ncbi:FAD-dependent catabolic D-arginine dehydrogenase DauA [Allostella sp. ATCC 35155]|nr:FAD-dependent catabolic D-arginine dehydrogenase DauA [Stella sp. ATCC 35155]
MQVDIVIIGGGIAGASAACFLSAFAKVALVEQEEHFGYHSSGRSAGQFTVGISAPTMRRMAQASRPFLEAPPAGFAEHPLLTPRGCLTVCRAGQEAKLDRLAATLESVGAAAERLDRAASLALFPALVADKVDAGLYEPGAMDMDVHAMLQGYLRTARANGALLLSGRPLAALRRESGGWVATIPQGELRAAVVVNAAGAWVDAVTRMAGLSPIGIRPHRRTAFTFASPPDPAAASWTHVGNVDYGWYVQPERGCFMGSLSDATPAEPGDAFPEDEDVAQAIHNIEQDTMLRIGRPIARWAGLRSFAADREPVAGTRPDAPGFYWLAGQGGCGILTSPAMGQAIAAIIDGRPLPDEQQRLGVAAADLSPLRPGLAGRGRPVAPEQ